MKSRKLPRSVFGRNLHDRVINIDYTTGHGIRTTRKLALYKVRVRLGGLILFDAYDFLNRAELTFRNRNVERLTDLATGLSWTQQDGISRMLMGFYRRQARSARIISDPRVISIESTLNDTKNLTKIA